MASINGPKNGAAERVALYLRVSSEEQRDAGTIQTQHEVLEGYVQLYGLEVAGWYEDDGVSGTIPLHERPAGRKLFQDADDGKFDSVLIYKLDRVGRTLLIIVDAAKKLEKCGVALRSATESIDTSTPHGRFAFQTLASVAELERENIRQRTRDGLYRAFRDGKYTGVVPYGYVADERARLVVVEKEATIVREIFERVSKGASQHSERPQREAYPATRQTLRQGQAALAKSVGSHDAPQHNQPAGLHRSS